MRDPERIGPMLEQLREAWEANPDLRLGQLIYNAAYESTGGELPPIPGLFYLEDEQLRRGLGAAR